MSAIPCVGACFSTAEEFMSYLEILKFGLWRPRFVTVHHTGGPDLKTWRGWQTRKPNPVSDEQWMKNLASYYGSPPPIGPKDGPWRSGPHFFFTPDHFCVLSPPTARGVHAKSFNANSWGLECVGDFDREPFDGAVRDKYVEGLACLHIASGLQIAPFQLGVRGLHFHRDDPKTTKTCPGTKVQKASLLPLIAAKISAMTDGSHDEDQPPPPAEVRHRTGVVNTDDLNVRSEASGKSPVVGTLDTGDKVTISGETKNGATTWYDVGIGFVAARFVTLDRES